MRDHYTETGVRMSERVGMRAKNGEKGRGKEEGV